MAISFVRLPDPDATKTLVRYTDSTGRRGCEALGPGSPHWAEYQAWCAAGNTLAYPPAPVETLDQLRARLSSQIDAAVANIYSAWTRFQAEYEARESAAQAFVNAGYSGDPGAWVTTFATAAGVTNSSAADRILQQATSLRNSLAALAAQRMRKYELQGCADAPAANEKYNDILSNVQTIAAGIK